MTSREIREKFLNYFKERGHTIVPSSSLVPEDDPSVLLTTAGMQQFKPYFVGKRDPGKDFGSKNTTSVQKSFRTTDIDEVGDETHLTFFEMLGNFSFGGYFKEEAIQYAHKFITQEMGLEISYVSIFEGDESVGKDVESENIWNTIDENVEVCVFGREDNFWGPTGDEGPCGPTTEIYVKDAKGEDVEIWNLVFNQYYCDKEGNLSPLETQGVDTGMGLERLVTVVQKEESVFDTDIFENLMEITRGLTESEKNARIVADHIRGSTFLISNGVEPSNTKQGYILRRLIRRAMTKTNNKKIDTNIVSQLVDSVIDQYSSVYEFRKNEDIEYIINTEIEAFTTTLDIGLKELRKIEGDISGKAAFDLYQSYGFPIELTTEIVENEGRKVDEASFQKEFEAHQEISRQGSDKQFKGGLADESEETTKLHTAHHLLLAALQEILGEEVKQRGSNITPERLRIDFAFDRKLTDEELQNIENIVNEKIEAGLDVVCKEMPREEAENIGAEMEFGTKYPDEVSVYFIQDEDGNVFSKEFCGGPHVENTKMLGKFRITKEESSSAGVRRIKAVLE